MFFFFQGHPKADGGYGWVVTAILFVINMLELGTFKSFGVFLLPIRESLECSITALGTAMATSHSACYILGMYMYVLHRPTI